MELISRQEAKAQGLKHYFTGIACQHGHVIERLVGNKNCKTCAIERDRVRNITPEAKKANRARAADWHAANPERARTSQAQNYLKNKEKIRLAQKEHYKNNKSAIRERQKTKYAGSASMKRDALRRAKEYDKQNPSKAAHRVMLRIARKLQATPAWADLNAIKAIYEQCAFTSRVTGEPHQVDHIYPLRGKTVCGLHVPANLQILTATENVKKSNKLLDDQFPQ